jgi:hypothetical protein
MRPEMNILAQPAFGAPASRTRTMTGEAYLKHWAYANFHFHVTMAYAILRHNGVEIGKADFLGSLD